MIKSFGTDCRMSRQQGHTVQYLQRMILALLLMGPTCNGQYFENRAYGKYGLGPCPHVPVMRDFDINKIYGGKWYVIAHFSEPHMADRKCTQMEYFDDNPGTDQCRVRVSRLSISTQDGEKLPRDFHYLLPDVMNTSQWIDDYGKWHCIVFYPVREERSEFRMTLFQFPLPLSMKSS